MPCRRAPMLFDDTDNGASLKATTVLAMLRWLGIERVAHSRPRVPSDDNRPDRRMALFRTAKYRFPSSLLKAGSATLTRNTVNTDIARCSSMHVLTRPTINSAQRHSRMLPRHMQP